MDEKIDFPVELRSEDEIKEFYNRCGNPRFVARCLKEHNMWRRSEGEYGLGDDDPKEYRSAPFGPKALGILIEYAIEYLDLYADNQEKYP